MSDYTYMLHDNGIIRLERSSIINYLANYTKAPVAYWGGRFQAAGFLIMPINQIILPKDNTVCFMESSGPMLYKLKDDWSRQMTNSVVIGQKMLKEVSELVAKNEQAKNDST